MNTKNHFRILLSLFVLITGMLLQVYFSGTIRAQVQPQQTTEETTENTDATKETLEETAEKSIEQVKKYLDPSKIQNALQGISNSHHGIVGEVQRINEDALTIENIQGTTILAIDSNTVTISKKDTNIKLSDIAVGNWVTILGYQEAEDFNPRFISVSENSLRPDTQLVSLGTITAISKSEVQITDRLTSEEKTFTFTEDSTVEDFAGEETTISEFEIDYNVLVVATTTDEKDFEIATIRSLAPLDELN